MTMAACFFPSPDLLRYILNCRRKRGLNCIKADSSTTEANPNRDLRTYSSPNLYRLRLSAPYFVPIHRNFSSIRCYLTMTTTNLKWSSTMQRTLSRRNQP
ncbi:hypothetical protein Moror_6111 [Moniliophthora roreri MCA 2997]|uniref:Uncharacterized protein n=1 Tax=Moniliophthora roreri (strain MCA 2997) TaxID=1381753 RepID=V2WSK3_MONRO|nr:hypothetical protein Moror_6111 [Moniliophthora roreri MCA 2997]